MYSGPFLYNKRKTSSNSSLMSRSQTVPYFDVFQCCISCLLAAYETGKSPAAKFAAFGIVPLISVQIGRVVGC